MDKLIPLLGLIGVGALLLLLLRMAKQELKAPMPAPAPATPMPVATPVESPRATPVTADSANEELAPEEPPIMAMPPAPTPVHTVLDLLKSKHALTSAFLLKEILGPPVSRRR